MGPDDSFAATINIFWSWSAASLMWHAHNSLNRMDELGAQSCNKVKLTETGARGALRYVGELLSRGGRKMRWAATGSMAVITTADLLQRKIPKLIKSFGFYEGEN